MNHSKISRLRHCAPGTAAMALGLGVTPVGLRPSRRSRAWAAAKPVAARLSSALRAELVQASRDLR